MDSNMAPSGRTGQDPTTIPGGITSYSHQAVPHYLPGLQLCLFSLYTYPSVSLSILFLYHLLFLVVPRLCIMSSRDHFGHGMPSEACVVLDWWSSQALLFPGNVRMLIIGMFTGQNIATLLSATY